MPWCASEISPGAGVLPPPTMPASLYVPVGAAVIDIVIPGNSVVPDRSPYAPYLREMQKMRAEGAFYGQIADWLNKKGIRRPLSGKKWDRSAVHHVLVRRERQNLNRPPSGPKQ